MTGREIATDFERFEQVNSKLNASRCSFVKRELMDVGNFLSEDRITCSPSHLEGVQKYAVPTNHKQLQQVLSFVLFFPKVH